MRKISPFMPPIFLMTLIFISSSIPMLQDDEQLKFLSRLNSTIQNFLHVPLYGFLSYLWLKSFVNTNFSMSNKICLTLAITLLYGFFDEFHQTFIPGRYGCITDVVFNSSGIVLGIIVFCLLKSKKIGKAYKAGRL
jgi:VanZ family protein